MVADAMPMLPSNRSFPTAGLDDPGRDWMQRTVRVIAHPEWGVARVLRWYPAAGGAPQRLRIMAEKLPAPQVVAIRDVEVVGGPMARS